MFDHKTYHPGSLVRFVMGRQYDLGAPQETGVVISTGERENHYGAIVQTVVIEFRADIIGATGRLEKESNVVFAMNMSIEQVSTGRQPNSNVIHVLSRYHTRCGSGDNTIGTRKRFHSIIENTPVTCKKCLKEMEKNPALKAQVTRQLIYANTGKFWAALGHYLTR